MKKVWLTSLLILFVLCFTGTHSSAQNNPNTLSWDISIIPGMAVADYGGASRFVLGADTRIQQRFAKNFAWMVSGGYTHFSALSNGYIHVKGGLKLFATSAVYFAGEVGGGEYTQGGEVFIYAMSIGTKAGKKWDLSLKYEDFSTFSVSDPQFAIRIGYRLSR